MINYIIINTIILRDTRMESGNRNLEIGIWNGSFRLPYERDIVVTLLVRVSVCLQLIAS